MTPTPGDMVVLGAHDGLGLNPFLILSVFKQPLGGRDLEVMAPNGTVWWARSQGARVVSRPEAP